jgi:hypothetical protein
MLHHTTVDEDSKVLTPFACGHRLHAGCLRNMSITLNNGGESLPHRCCEINCTGLLLRGQDEVSNYYCYYCTTLLLLKLVLFCDNFIRYSCCLQRTAKSRSCCEVLQ